MKTIKKVLAIVLIASLMLGCFAICASAGSSYCLYIAGTEVTGTGEIKNDRITKGTVYFDADTFTLTLNNATIKSNNGATYTEEIVPIYCGLQDDDTLTIIIEGDCIINCTDGYNAIDSSLNLSIEGKNDASLTFNLSKSSSAYGEKDLSISNLDIDVNYSGATYQFRTAFLAKEALSIENCEINIKDSLAGIVSEKSINITNSKFDIEEIADGIALYDNSSDPEKINISNCDIKIVEKNRAAFRTEVNSLYQAYPNLFDICYPGVGGCIGLVYNCGIHSDTDVNIDNTKFDITTPETCGIYAKNNVVLKDCVGKLVTTSTNDERAIYSEKVTVSDNMSIIAGDTASDADAINVKTMTDLKDYSYVELTNYFEVETNASWTKGSADGISVSSKANLATFQNRVDVDGKEISASNYTATDGSTKITFTPAYLETLSIGEHPVVIYSNGGKATGTLTIREKVTPTPPAKEEEEEEVAQTGDNTIIATFVAASALSAAAFVSLKKKEQY